MQNAVERAAAHVRAADALLITAGAGMGVDSGLPDFRGNTGFWKAYPPLQMLGLSFQDMANPDWFRRDPELAWGFYGHRLELYRQTEPHAGFRILREWAEAMPNGWFAYTSNVDGQFQRAGFTADRVAECHGSIHHLQCQERGGIWSADGITVPLDAATLRARELPQCSCCGRVARPNILMFGDFRWDASRSHRQEAAYRAWLRALPPTARLAVIEIGAGTHIPTVRREGEDAARRDGAALIRINPREAEGDGGIVSLPMGAGEALAAIRARL